MVKRTTSRGSEANRRGRQDGRIWLADTHASLGLFAHLGQNQIARVLFYVDAKGRMVLLHGFIKKTQKTPPDDLELARKNMSKHEKGPTQ